MFGQKSLQHNGEYHRCAVLGLELPLKLDPDLKITDPTVVGGLLPAPGGSLVSGTVRISTCIVQAPRKSIENGVGTRTRPTAKPPVTHWFQNHDPYLLTIQIPGPKPQGLYFNRCVF